MTITAILLFEEVEELDFAGPYEVFGMARLISPEDQIYTVAKTRAPVRCYNGLRVVPEHDFASAPQADVLLIPGGMGTRSLMADEDTLAWVKRLSAGCSWVTSVCTGSLVLASTGQLDGRRATSHHLALDELRKFDKLQVMEKVRYVRDGRYVTSAGVSAGIDMSLWLIGQLYGDEAARQVQNFMQYDPAPPYQAAV